MLTPAHTAPLFAMVLAVSRMDASFTGFQTWVFGVGILQVCDLKVGALDVVSKSCDPQGEAGSLRMPSQLCGVVQECVSAFPTSFDVVPRPPLPSV